MKNFNKTYFIKSAILLLVTLSITLSGCSSSQPDKVIVAKTKQEAFDDDTLASDSDKNNTKDDPLINYSHKRSVEDIDYNVYGIYIRVYPTYDENGVLVTRKIHENFIPRDRTYNPNLDCTVWYSETEVENPSSLNTEDGMVGTMRVRGNSSRGNPLKNFKVKLTEPGDKIFGFDSLNINKHFVDETRTINKACFDIMQLQAVNFVSMETKFLRLYISDVDENGNETGFIDQGIYTFVEQPNKDFLVNHGLDPNGTVYKAMAFEFLPYEEELRSKDDPLYDEWSYYEVIKPLANENHDKLRNMLDDVNNYSLEFPDVMEKYFDEENYLTWMAYNILLGNIDTLAHNFLLYSPSNSEKFYMMPWDFDGSLNDYGITDMGINNYQSFGIHFYWTIPLHQRYFRIEGNIEKLNARIEEVMNTVTTQENLAYIQNKTIEVVTPFLERLPTHENSILHALYVRDANIINEPITAINKWYESIQNNYQRYFMNLDNPTSSNVIQPIYENDEWVFRWEASYDFQHEQVTYDFLVATDPDFENLIDAGYDLPVPIFKTDELPKGHIYFQYIAKDTSGHVQYPLNRLSIKDINGNTLVRKRGVGHYDNESGDIYVIENEIFGDDMVSDEE